MLYTILKKKIFKEQVTIGENHAIELLMTDAEQEIEAEKLIKMLRDEFFLIIEPFYEDKEKYEPDIIEQAFTKVFAHQRCVNTLKSTEKSLIKPLMNAFQKL